jgi:hypothetical protein
MSDCATRRPAGSDRTTGETVTSGEQFGQESQPTHWWRDRITLKVHAYDLVHPTPTSKPCSPRSPPTDPHLSTIEMTPLSQWASQCCAGKRGLLASAPDAAVDPGPAHPGKSVRRRFTSLLIFSR